jgi:hypothetical protein
MRPFHDNWVCHLTYVLSVGSTGLPELNASQTPVRNA